jgi:protein-disulfide isomerase
MRSSSGESEPTGPAEPLIGFWRLGAILAAFLLGGSCARGGGPGAASDPEAVELPGVDTSALTGRERRDWSGYVSELLAPCADQPVSVAECVRQARPCVTCAPAAAFIARQVVLGKARRQVETAYRLRFAPDQVKSIDLGQSPWKGAASARVVIVEWADFECPFCQRTAPEFDRLLQAYPGVIKVVFKHYPIASHANAMRAARAGVAAQRQGKFWRMHDLMFLNATRLDDPGLERLATEAGMEVARFKADLADPTVADRINADRKQADALGLQGTPMIFIDGRYFDLEYFDLSDDLGPWVKLEVELVTGRRVEPRSAPSALPRDAGVPPDAVANPPSAEAG